MSRCAKPLQFFQAKSDLNFAPKREELDKLCPEFNNGLRCIGSYTRRCMTQVQRDQFNKIYQGTNELIKDLCNEGDYQNEFLKHSPCLQTVKPRHVKCADRYQQTMSSIFKASANQTAYNQQQQQQPVGAENDAENIKIVCWWVWRRRVQVWVDFEWICLQWFFILFVVISISQITLPKPDEFIQYPKVEASFFCFILKNKHPSTSSKFKFYFDLNEFRPSNRFTRITKIFIHPLFSWFFFDVLWLLEYDYGNYIVSIFLCFCISVKIINQDRNAIKSFDIAKTKIILKWF